MKIIVLFIGFILIGCTHQLSDADRCNSYGFRMGTNEFAQCMQNIDLNRRNAAVSMFMANKPVTCRSFGSTTACQ